MCHLQWNATHWSLRWIINGLQHTIFNGSCHGTTAIIMWLFRIGMQSGVWKQDHMADQQKFNIPLGGYGKGMSLGHRHHDIPISTSWDIVFLSSTHEVLRYTLIESLYQKLNSSSVGNLLGFHQGPTNSMEDTAYWLFVVIPKINSVTRRLFPETHQALCSILWADC